MMSEIDSRIRVIPLVGAGHCPKCGAEYRREEYHVKRLPVGTPGRHIGRLRCDCGVQAVDSYFVLDRQKIKPRISASLLFVAALPEESLKNDPILELFIVGSLECNH